MDSIYLIGSLRNEKIVDYSNLLRHNLPGVEIFDDWWAVGRRADDYWKEYEQAKGNNYAQALKGWAAKHVFEFDKFHLDRCDAALLIMPAGKSGFLELGYAAGQGKPVWIVYPDGDPDDRYDVMFQFATGIAFSMEELLEQIEDYLGGPLPTKEVGPPFPEFGPTGKHLEQRSFDEVRSGDSEPEGYESIRAGIQRFSSGDG